MSSDVGTAAFPGERVRVLRGFREELMALKLWPAVRPVGVVGARGALRVLGTLGTLEALLDIEGIADMGDTEGVGVTGDKATLAPIHWFTLTPTPLDTGDNIESHHGSALITLIASMGPQ